MLQLDGRVADAVVVGLGMGDLAREYAAEHIARGAHAAGRDPASIDVWYLSYLNIARTPGDGAKEVGSALAVGGNLLAKSAARTIIPDAVRPRLAELASRYSYVQHAGGGDKTRTQAFSKSSACLDTSPSSSAFSVRRKMLVSACGR